MSSASHTSGVRESGKESWCKGWRSQNLDFLQGEFIGRVSVIEPKVCFDKLLQDLGKKGWEVPMQLTGGTPALKLFTESFWCLQSS